MLKRVEIEKVSLEIEKVGKLITNLHDKKEYVIHIRNLKQALNHGVVLKKVHKGIKFNQKAWLKPYIDINTKLRKNAESDSEKYISLGQKKVVLFPEIGRVKFFLSLTHPYSRMCIRIFFFLAITNE